MANAARKLNVRAFVALAAAFSGLGLPVTGVAVHLHAFSPLTVARHAWMSAHNVLGILFTVFAICHVVLNRRALQSHLKGAASQVPALNREAALAGVVVGFALLLFVGHAFLVG